MAQVDAFLSLKDICNSFGKVRLLNRINLELYPGEILCLLGQSGSGKTTLLRVIAGLENYEAGHINFKNTDLSLTPSHKRNFGMMFQEYALFPHKNVFDNIAFGLEMKRVSKLNIATQVDKMLELVGLSGFGHRRIDELSGGEQQRVALARCLAPKPDLLLLDEPLGSLDRSLRDKLATDIKKILKSLGLTAIFVTHDQAEAFSIADRIGILHKGCLEQLDTPFKLYSTPRTKEIARFLGFTNLLSGYLDQSTFGFDCDLGNVRLPKEIVAATLPSKQRTLLIRPDGASFTTEDHYEPDGFISLACEVTDVSYLGSNYRITLVSNTIPLTFDFPLYPAPPKIGSKTSVRIPKTSLVLL